MNVEIGYWKRTDDGRKFKVRLRVFGGKILWEHQPARFEDWAPYPEPDDEDCAGRISGCTGSGAVEGLGSASMSRAVVTVSSV